MDKRAVILIAAASAAAGYVTAQYPALTAKAGIVEHKGHEFDGTATSAVKAKWEASDCVIGQAVAHANTQLELSGDDALNLNPGQCPIEHLRITCRVDAAGQRQWDWDYRTKKLTWTRVLGEPQE